MRCPGYVSALYQAAGLVAVAEWEVGVELVTDSPAQYWEMISEHVSLAVAALAQAGEPARERIAKAVIARADTYEHNGRVRIRGVARYIAGMKQGHRNRSICAQVPSRGAHLGSRKSRRSIAYKPTARITLRDPPLSSACAQSHPFGAIAVLTDRSICYRVCN